MSIKAKLIDIILNYVIYLYVNIKFSYIPYKINKEIFFFVCLPIKVIVKKKVIGFICALILIYYIHNSYSFFNNSVYLLSNSI